MPIKTHSQVLYRRLTLLKEKLHSISFHLKLKVDNCSSDKVHRTAVLSMKCGSNVHSLQYLKYGKWKQKSRRKSTGSKPKRT